MLYVLTTREGNVLEFSVKGCAELYCKLYGGHILERVEFAVEDDVLTEHITS